MCSKYTLLFQILLLSVLGGIGGALVVTGVEKVLSFLDFPTVECSVVKG